MLSLRARIFIIISLLILVILGLSIVLSMRSRKSVLPQDNGSVDGGAPNVTDSANFNYQPNIVTPLAGGEVPQGTPIKPATTLETEQNAVRQYAKIFAERYHTYSTDNNFVNIIEIKDLVTPELWKSLSIKMDQPMATNNFIGVTTKVFTSEITHWENNAATVMLRATIQEDKKGASTERQRDLTVDLIKVDTDWLVNKFQWATQ